MAEDKILRLRHVQDLVGGPAKSTIYRWIQHGDFPASVRLGGCSIGWRESDINRWIENRPPALGTD